MDIIFLMLMFLLVLPTFANYFIRAYKKCMGSCGNLSMLRQYLKGTAHLSDQELLKFVLNTNRNVLMGAVLEGNFKLTLALLKLGASYDVVNRRGLYPIHIAAEKGYVDILQLLVDWGADINTLDHTGYTALHRAILKGKASTVKMILEKPININQTNGAGWTAMHLAACEGHVQIAKLLVNAGADINAKDKDGWTPLYLAKLYKKRAVEDYIKSVGGM